MLRCSADIKLIFVPVYLECQSKDPESASKGATEALKYVALNWFNDPRLAMERKYGHLL